MAAGSTLLTLLERLIVAVESLVILAAIVGSVYLFGHYLVVRAVLAVAAAAKLDETATLTVEKVTVAVFALLGLYLAIPLSGLATTPTTVAALSAGATIAVGFAARDVLSNLVSGAFIVLDPTFRVGDWIAWNDNEGIIEDIDFRVTRIHTFDNELVTVPNSHLTANVVTNPVAKPRRRITYDFGIGYGDDIDQAREILVETALDHGEVIDRPAPRVLLVDLAESAVGLRAQFWIADPARAEFLRVRSEYVQTVKERFDQAGIDLPYPHRQLTGGVGVWETEAPDEPPPGIE